MDSDENNIFIQPGLIDKLKMYQSSKLRAMQMAPTGTPLGMSPQGNVQNPNLSFAKGGEVPEHPLARQLASAGRNGDDTMLHVNKKELGGIATLLKKPLTTNPKTGLPEAFGWSDILPIAASAAAAFATDGMSIPMQAAASGLAAGGARMLTGGSLQQGLMTGLMAGGATGVMGSLGAAGDAAIASPTQTAAPQALNDVSQTVSKLAPNTPLMNPEAVGDPALSSSTSSLSPQQIAQQTVSKLAPGATIPSQTGVNVIDKALYGAQQAGALNAAKPYALAMGVGAMGNYMGNMQGQGMPPAATLPASNYAPQSPHARPVQFPTGNQNLVTTPISQYAPQSNTPGQYDYFPTNGFAGGGGVAALDQGGDAKTVRALRRAYPSREVAAEAATQKGSLAQQFGVTGPDSPLLDFAFGPKKDPRYINGAGDGMSDSVPATINGNEPAALADGEFVVPADVVSHLGNGSTKAGAKHLHKVMDKVRTARTGTSEQGKQIDPNKFLPA